MTNSDDEALERMVARERDMDELSDRLWNEAASTGKVDGLLDIGDGFYVHHRLGSVPVSYCGVVEGRCFYFKSRGTAWRFVLARKVENCFGSKASQDNDAVDCEFWSKVGPASDNFAAGYMELEQAEEIIKACYRLWKVGLISKSEQE